MKSFKKLFSILILIVSGFQYLVAQDAFVPTMKIEGRIMYDFEFLSAGDDYHYSGNEFRRVRAAAKGMIAKNIGYKAEFDFADGKVNFRDVFLKIELSSLGTIKAGSFTEPSSLGNMTSSKYITFFERAMMANTQPFKYNAGILYENQNILKGNLRLQVSYTFNGDKHEAFKDTNLKQGANFVARLTSVILKNKKRHRMVHLGVNYENRKNNSGSYHYKFRQENHMGDKFEVGVDEKFKNTNDIGFELATTFGPLALQSEYEISSIITDTKTFTANGYYGFISFFVTGEHRPYKKGAFGRVKPKNRFSIKDGGIGAIELVARYSVMDVSNFQENGKITNFTAGFNWYLNKHSRIMYNYTTGTSNKYNDNNLVGHLIRFQVDF